jgi:hypothetical protein
LAIRHQHLKDLGVKAAAVLTVAQGLDLPETAEASALYQQIQEDLREHETKISALQHDMDLCENTLRRLFATNLRQAYTNHNQVLEKINALESWKDGEPFPIYMNLTNNSDVKIFFGDLLKRLEIENFEFDDLYNYVSTDWYLDSYDESKFRTNLV